MGPINERLEQFQLKLSQLLKQHVVLQKENNQLKKENAKLKSQLESKEQQMAQLQNQHDALKLSKDGFSEEEKKELEKKIDAYVKEIDYCLSILNS